MTYQIYLNGQKYGNPHTRFEYAREIAYRAVRDGKVYLKASDGSYSAYLSSEFSRFNSQVSFKEYKAVCNGVSVRPRRKPNFKIAM